MAMTGRLQRFSKRSRNLDGGSRSPLKNEGNQVYGHSDLSLKMHHCNQLALMKNQINTGNPLRQLVNEGLEPDFVFIWLK